jgi:hypothetical protein
MAHCLQIPYVKSDARQRQGYAALKAGRLEIITGLVNRMVAISTRFTPTSILLMIAGRLTAAEALPAETIERLQACGDHHGITSRSRTFPVERALRSLIEPATSHLRGAVAM